MQPQFGPLTASMKSAQVESEQRSFRMYISHLEKDRFGSSSENLSSGQFPSMSQLGHFHPQLSEEDMNCAFWALNSIFGRDSYLDMYALYARNTQDTNHSVSFFTYNTKLVFVDNFILYGPLDMLIFVKRLINYTNK
jgi:hypothetical protein